MNSTSIRHRLWRLTPHVAVLCLVAVASVLTGYWEFLAGWQFALRQTLVVYLLGLAVVVPIRIAFPPPGVRWRVTQWLSLATMWPAWWYFWVSNFEFATEYSFVVRFILGVSVAVAVDASASAWMAGRDFLALAGVAHTAALFCLVTVANFYFDQLTAPTLSLLAWWWSGLALWAVAVLVATGCALAFDGFDGWRPSPLLMMGIGVLMCVVGMVLGPADFYTAQCAWSSPHPFTVLGASEFAGGMAVILGAVCGRFAVYFRPELVVEEVSFLR
ncbi:hypothetical protein [Corynebacterium aquilae]|uniref:Uncharacterized protein n=1 Tax=Corynebacterium aquilae DSM 44791 TaxID=1431546 RepID=A0A1L7CD51_9CORY|nr:hypothetical protein [Corynebacterium aquilae]APT83766.1 hypothetical protein CAQU_00180 [Corynebacterium aquilae DSM 44791]